MKRSVQYPRFPAVPAAVVAALLMTVVACSGGDGKKSATASGVSCRQSKDSATWRAVISYTKTSDPYAQRFLSAWSSDSSLPEVGVAALQERGPTWLFPKDSAGRTKV